MQIVGLTPEGLFAAAISNFRIGFHQPRRPNEMAAILDGPQYENEIAVFSHVGVGKISDGQLAVAWVPKHYFIDFHISSDPTVTQ
jgi:hypothetical protein